MSIETIRMALGRLQDDPDDEAAWDELAEAVTAPSGLSQDEVERLLGLARARHEQRREWGPVARLLELEIALSQGSPVEVPMQAELARIYHEELVDVERGRATYNRLLQLRPGDPTATEAIEADEEKAARWREIVSRYVAEAESASEDTFKSALYTSAADIAFRYGRAEAPGILETVAQQLDQALRLDKRNRRAAALAELVYAATKDYAASARIQEHVLVEAASKEDRLAAGLRLGRTASKKLGDASRAVRAYQAVLDLAPGQQDALAYLAEAYSNAGDWDHLVALYEDQLRGGGVRPAEEVGVLVQIAMVHWRMRGKPQEAETYFDRVRRADPAHAGMLSFFRELCTAKGDKTRLATILTDAQRAMKDGEEKRALATEIARLAESQENAQKAIEQYKTILRTDPENVEARDALKRLYVQTGGHNALVELYRQDLDRTPPEDTAARLKILRDIAAIYRERAKSESALVTVLSQIVALDDKDVDAVRELATIYEALGRWRDLLTTQQRLAELSADPAEKANLYRSAARRWLEQFSNVQNAVAAYEGLLEVQGDDAEAIEKLRELYQKRRAWPQLYALYERQLAGTEGKARIEILAEMAKLAAERLDRGADAISLQKKILEIDPHAPGVFDALEKQAEREKDFGTLAEVLEQRVTTAADDATRLNVLQKLGTVYSERLKDNAATKRTWQRVLEASPGHAKALRVLRDAYVAESDWDGLEGLYASQNDWEGLVEFLTTTADRASSPEDKVAISFRAARIYEEKLGAAERAARSYERVLTVHPKDERAARALVPIYEKEEKWARLPALYEILLGATEDETATVELLKKLAATTGGPLADKAAAVEYARRAYDIASDAETLGLLESWARAASQWEGFVSAVEARLKKKKGLTNPLKRSLRLKLAEVYARELGKLDEAVASYRDLVESDPTDTDTIQTLDQILRSTGRKDDLRWLFQLRADQVEGAARGEIFEEWATLEEEVFGDAKAACELLRKVIEITPTRGEALRSLSRLLIQEGDFAAAAEAVERHRDVSEGADRARREVDLAALYLDHLARPAAAFDAAVRALGLSAHDNEAIAILARLVEQPETRVRAAEVLVTEYDALGDARREVGALGVVLEAEKSAEKRLALHLEIANVHEKKLSAPGTAFDAVQKALAEFPAELVLWDRANELANVAVRPTDLAETYRTHLVTTATADRNLPNDVELELCERAASLHDERLGDAEGAMPYLERVLASAPTNERAFRRLKQILTTNERWVELEALYERAAQGTTDERTRVELLSEVALVAEEIIGSAPQAIGYYERVLAIDPLCEPAIQALEKLYEREERWSDLAELLERRLDTATEAESIVCRKTLGGLYIERLGKPERALGHLEEVLDKRQEDLPSRELVEKLLAVPELRQRAARVLERVYEGRDEIRALVRILDIRRESATDDEKRELLRRAATYRDERLKDDSGAFAALAELLPLEPEEPSARERFVAIGRRLGEHEMVALVLSDAADKCRTTDSRAQILMEVARICEDMLGDVARAEGVYKAILLIDPNDPALVIPAAQALSRIYAAEGRHEDLAGSLGVEVRLEDNVETRRALYERIGTLYDGVLDQPEKAIEAWNARLADEPSDVAALTALERLYERTAAWRRLVEVLHTREQNATDPAERRRTMVRGAEILAKELGDVPEAINAWRAVLDELGPEKPTLTALEALYEKAERWVDLAETLEVDLSLTEETAERLALLVRLGDVRRLHQDDLPGALDAYRQALVLDPGHAPSCKALEAMLELESARRDAAAILRPLYEADGDAERLLRVLEIQVETGDSVTEQLADVEMLYRTAEGPLGDTARAYGYALRGVRMAAAEPELGKLIETLERFSESTGRWAETAALYQEIEGEILDGEVQQSVRLRIGELARTRLGDRALAITYYNKALEAHGDDRRAMLALEELYAEADDAPALLQILKTRVDYAESDDEKKKLLFRVAELSRGALADRAAAIATYEEVLGVGLDPAAIAALEELYRQAERYGDLIALYERQLEAGGPGADLHVKIAVVARGTGDIARTFDELGAALGDDPNHAGAITELETLLAGEDKEHRARAGEMLEPVYLARADWANVKLALGARLAAAQDAGERRELLQKLAALQEEQLEDYRAALDTVAELLHEDLSDEDVWKELDRLAKVAGAEKRLAEIYAKELGEQTSDDASSAKLCRITGDLFVAQGEQEAALTWYRRAHAESPESEELFKSIDAILIAKERHAERVELYRGALDYRYGEDRLATLHTIAGLLRKELSDPAGAIETYRAALEADENDTTSLEALTELYAQLGRHRDLAEHYQRRAESTADVEASAAFRLEWAKLLRGPLDDMGGAIDQLETIVNDVPWNTAAVTELEALLESDEHKARVVDILRPIYERGDDWKKLIKLNRVRLELADTASEKVTILRENASLLESRGDDQLGAFEAVRTAFELDAEDGETRRELERLAGELGAFEELALSLEKGATATSDDLVKRELFTTLARIYNERSDDPRRALDAFARLSALDPSDPEPLTAMDDLAVLLADWPTVISVLEKKSVIASDDENASIQRRIAETKLDMLDDVEGAILAYERALELDPRSAFTIDRLIELYEPRDAARRLVELYHQRVDLTEPDEADLRYDLNLAAATRYEKSLANPREAIGALTAALDARPSDPAVLKNLERLYRAEEMWHELLENLKLQAAAADTKEARVALRRDIGDLYAGKLDTPSDALEQYRLLLDEEAGDDHAIQAILAIGEAQDGLRLEAADALEPVLRAASRHADLVTVLELRLRAQSEPADRARTLRTIASVYDADLSRPADAVTALLRALEDAPDDPFLHQEIERLAEPADAFGRYADTLAQRAAGIFDAAVATDLFVRLGRVAEDKLKDDARAVDAYVKAIEHAGDKPELLAALDRLYARLGDAKALADVLERRVASAEGDADAAELHHRLAVIQIESFGDRAQGLATLRQALERVPAHAGARAALEKLTEHKDLFEEAAEALEAVYRSQADYVALAALGDKRVAFAESPADRVRLRLDLARIQEEQGDDPKAAQATLEKALGDDPTDADVLAELERLAPVTDGWKSASDALEAAIRGREDVPSETARDLWTRIAAWRKDKLGDAEGSERALEEARKLDPSSEWVLRSIEGLQRVPGRERDLVGTLRRLAALDGIAGASDLRREAKTLADSALGDKALAEQILREMIAADDADTWALTELGALREAAGAWEEVFSLLQRRIELSVDGDSLRSLRHEAAKVARTRLSSNDRAIGLLEQCFEDDPMDRDASTALRELYAEGGKHKEHIALLTRLVDIAESPAERSQLRLATAKICLEKLDAPGEAMDHLKAILDEEPGHEEATLTLSTLYEKTGRDQDLAELLTSQIELAERTGDVGAELRFRVRLGEVFETRLGDVPKAIATYEAVLEREAAHKGALLALARLFEHKGDKAAAAAKLERVLAATQGPDAVPLALRLADLYVALKDDDATRKALERGLAEGPTDRTLRDRLLALYEKQGAWAELADLITGDARAATEAPEKVRLYQKAADIQLQKRKDSGAAADLLEKASELVPGDRDLLLALCDAYSASGRGKQAIVALKKIVESYGGRRSKELAGIQLRLARAFVADGDKDQALLELDIAFKIDPGSVHVLRELGLLSLDLADAATDDAVKAAHVERAAKSFRALLLQRLDDTSPITKAEVFYRLGDISNRQGDPKKAIQNLERAIDNDKELTKAKELLATLKGK